MARRHSSAPKPTPRHIILLALSYRSHSALVLLAGQELYALEDLIADYVELKTEMAGRVITKQMIHSSPGLSFTAAGKLQKLVALAQAMNGDAAFARQARKRFL